MDSKSSISVLHNEDSQYHRAKARYRAFKLNVSRDALRLDRIRPRIDNFFKKLNHNGISLTSKRSRSDNSTLSHSDRVGVNSPNKKEFTHVKRSTQKSNPLQDMGQSNSELDLQTNSGYTASGSSRSGANSGLESPSPSDPEKLRWTTKSNKSFGTVRIEVSGKSVKTKLLVLNKTIPAEKIQSSSRSRIKSILNRDHVYRSPWISRVLSPLLEQHLSSSQREGWCEVSRRDVASQDAKAIQSYTRDGGIIPESLWILLYRSGDEAIRRLTGLTPEEKGSIELSSPEEAVKHLSKDTNSGFPLFEKKNVLECQQATLKSVKQLINHPCLNRMVGGNVSFCGSTADNFLVDGFKYVQVIFHRLQVSVSDSKDFNVKVRQVWCVPFTIVALEYVYFNKFIKRAIDRAKSSDRSIYSSGLSSKGISEKIIAPLKESLSYVSNSQGRFLCNGDYSKFDWSIQIELIDIFFDQHRYYLKQNRKQGINFDYLCFYYKFAPFVYKSQIWFKKRGISSGLYCTNYFDSYVNLTLCIAAESLNASLQPKDRRDYLLNNRTFGNIGQIIERTDYTVARTDFNLVAVCGDDLLWITDIVQNRILIELCNTIDMVIGFGPPNDFFSDNLFFLGRYWNSDNEPYQTEDYLIAHALFRTKRYDKQNVQFRSEEELELFRVLSIYTPFVNGWECLIKHLGDWPPLLDFIRTNGSFKLLKDWPYDNYLTVDYQDSLRWDSPAYEF